MDGREDDDASYEVEAVLDAVSRDGDLKFCVKWKGWSSKQCTWESIEHLTSCEDALNRFFQSRRSGRALAKTFKTRTDDVESIDDLRINTGTGFARVSYDGRDGIAKPYSYRLVIDRKAKRSKGYPDAESAARAQVSHILELRRGCPPRPHIPSDVDQIRLEDVQVLFEEDDPAVWDS